jgi:GH18 family chitinase
MTYDYHGPWDQNVNHFAPLYANKIDNEKSRKLNIVSINCIQFLHHLNLNLFNELSFTVLLELYFELLARKGS